MDNYVKDEINKKKLAYVFKNYPNLDETAFKKLVGSFKTVEDMINYDYTKGYPEKLTFTV